MIRLISCIRRREDISPEEFRNYWNSEEFEQLIERLAEIAEAKAVSKNLTLQVAVNEQIMAERGSSEPFDATLEFLWVNAAELMEKTSTPEALAVREEMIEYQKQFADISRCHTFFTEFETKMLS